MATFPQKTPPTLLVCAALLLQDDKVLLTRRPAHKPHGGYWEFPGGKIDPGESPEQALQRELEEELGLCINVGRIADALFHRYEQGPVLILFYHCRILSGTPQNIEVDEHRWIPIPDLGRYKILPADRPLIDRLQSDHRQPTS